MKPAIYFTLVHRWTPTGNFKILAVTSEGPRGRVNGREEPDGFPTHTTARQCVGRFEKLEDAKVANAKVLEIRAKHAAAIDAAEDAVHKARAAEHNEIHAHIKSLGTP